jgi:ParB family chromosome partitioning protein
MSVKVHASTVEMVPVADLLAYEKNARTHSDHQVQVLAEAIKASGFTNPLIIDPHNVLIAGHGRLEAARALGMPEVPCVRVTGLTETQITALRLSDNQIGLLSGWDEDLLREELRALTELDVDLSGLGFDDGELSRLFDQPDEAAEPETSTKEINPDDYQMGHTCPKCGFEFDAET